MQDSIVEDLSQSDAYFEDGQRKVYYILAITRISAFENYKVINTYIRNLQVAGLQFEQCYGITEPVVFVKVHLPEEILLSVQEKYYAWKDTLVTSKGKRKRQLKCVKWFKTALHYRQVLVGDSNCGTVVFTEK
ncbi:unnamed protein product [Brassicogethes aeneus]|uniref:Anoctamin dimerisation domain-containing protein n=1 Tax=Brassicogethes aeneus TaxID=1431903 RepID=A0A9P0AN65_BRAAE|nr:unnamed protein product [Brassicogethes aeneus]